MNIKKSLDKSQVVSLYLGGTTLSSLAKQFHLKSYGPIKRVLKESNILLRRKGSIRIKTGLSLDIDYFHIIDSPEKAYWLGFLTADGYVYPNGYKTTLCSKDIEVIEKFKSAIKSGHSISERIIKDKRTRKKYKHYYIQVTSSHFCKHLIALGLKGQKSFICSPPVLLHTLLSHYIRGLFDGDGSICFLKSGKRRISLIATRPILDMVKKYLVSSLGFSKVKYQIIASNSGNDICKLHIYRQKDQDAFLAMIYNESANHMRLLRKFRLAQLKT